MHVVFVGVPELEALRLGVPNDHADIRKNNTTD